MSKTEIEHFLVVYDIRANEAHVDTYGEDYDAAMTAYAKAEQEYRGRDDIEVVLLGADSLDTVKKTHSSYFSTHEGGFERFFSAAENDQLQSALSELENLLASVK